MNEDFGRQRAGAAPAPVQPPQPHPKVPASGSVQALAHHFQLQSAQAVTELIEKVVGVHQNQEREVSAGRAFVRACMRWRKCGAVAGSHGGV